MRRQMLIITRRAQQQRPKYAVRLALTEQLRYTNGQPFTRGGQIAEAVGMLLEADGER